MEPQPAPQSAPKPAAAVMDVLPPAKPQAAETALAQPPAATEPAQAAQPSSTTTAATAPAPSKPVSTKHAPVATITLALLLFVLLSGLAVYAYAKAQ